FTHVPIHPGKALTIARTSGFTLMRDFFKEESADLRPLNVTIDGAGAKLVVSNQNASMSILSGNGLIPTLSMSNLDTFIAKVSRIGIADYQLYPNYRDLNTALSVGRDTNA